MNSLNRSGPFGSATFQKDPSGNVTGQQTSLAPGLQPGADAATGATSSQLGLLPTTGINFDDTTAPKIAQQNYDAYSAMTAPQRAQQESSLNTMLSDRGIPLGSEIDQNERGNLSRGNAIADTNAAAQAWNAAPGMQNQITANQVAQYNQPIDSARQSLGLLGNMNSLAPNAPQGTGTTQAPDYSQLVQNQYNAQMGQYNSQMSGLGSLLGTGASLLAAPLTGGTSLLGLGMGGLGLLGGASTGNQGTSSNYSDARLKENISPVGKLKNGKTVYSYTFKGDPRTQIGLIAQEVLETHPHAVTMDPSGMLMVDYAKAVV